MKGWRHQAPEAEVRQFTAAIEAAAARGELQAISRNARGEPMYRSVDCIRWVLLRRVLDPHFAPHFPFTLADLRKLAPALADEVAAAQRAPQKDT